MTPADSASARSPKNTGDPHPSPPPEYQGRRNEVISDRAAQAPAPVADTKPYVQHHPIIGYTYIPGAVQTLPAPSGGRYTIRINSAGIRSDREYSFAKPPGVRRILIFGDSMSAGQFIGNENRFSELLERKTPNLEVMNLSLEGSGTDQQLLLFEHFGKQFEFDLVMLFPFVQNIYRNMVDAREGRDPVSLKPVLIPKPRFELVDGKLQLRNVPVPMQRSEVSKANASQTDTDPNLVRRMKHVLSRLPGSQAIKKVAYGIKPWEPFAVYKNPQSPQWQLMAAIIRRFKELAGERPLVLVPTFYSNYVRLRMARNYWLRFNSLTDAAGIYAIDLLPHFKRLGSEAVRCFQEPFDMHFSAYGNLIIAEAIQAELQKQKLL